MRNSKEAGNMKMRILLIVCFILLLPAIVSCQMLKNRKLQSAGFGGYCSNCLVKNLDEDVEKLQNAIQESNSKLVKYQAVKTPVPVRSAVMLDANGKVICHINLLKYPDLVPDFAKLDIKKTAYQVAKSQRKLASVAKGSNLPSCTGKYLRQLRRLAKKNIVLNSDQSPIHKSGWKTDSTVGVAACVLGIGIHRAFNEDSAKKPTSPTFRLPVPGGDAVVAGSISGLSAILLNHYEDQYAQIQKAISTTGKNMDGLWQMKNKILVNLAVTAGTFCYFGKEMTMVIYENIMY